MLPLPIINIMVSYVYILVSSKSTVLKLVIHSHNRFDDIVAEIKDLKSVLEEDDSITYLIIMN